MVTLAHFSLYHPPLSETKGAAGRQVSQDPGPSAGIMGEEGREEKGVKEGRQRAEQEGRKEGSREGGKEAWPGRRGKVPRSKVGPLLLTGHRHHREGRGE